ncbi:hypothetical protein B2M27_26395 [Kluyvera intermedia]|uniref:Secreted protein n=1 Tax=Kluyvera intermedia TaxID=61648 RepID=A0ABX3U770_KLUIN|nr:hypothetical protein B2M27_26395 [Kluyvera intermedia]
MIILLITICICNSVLSRFGERVFHYHNALVCGFLRMSPFANEWQWHAVFLTRWEKELPGMRQEKQEKQ